MKRVAWAYIAAIVVAEIVGAVVSAPVGAAAHALLIVVLLLNFVGQEAAPYRRLLPALLLIPLLRLLSLALPSPDIPQLYWYAIVGTPVLWAALLAARLLNSPATPAGFTLRFSPIQAAIALSGLPLGIVAYLILRPAPLLAGFDVLGLVIGTISLAVFAGFLEEFIFRGLLLQTAREVLGRPAAIIGSSLLFATVYVGSFSLPFLLLIGLMGVGFAYCVDKTGSLWGVTVAHSLMAVGLIIFWPAVASLPR